MIPPCKRHPKYDGRQYPRDNCPTCHAFFNYQEALRKYESFRKPSTKKRKKPRKSGA